jgi:hypothetical protein
MGKFTVGQDEGFYLLAFHKLNVTSNSRGNIPTMMAFIVAKRPVAKDFRASTSYNGLISRLLLTLPYAFNRPDYSQL